MTNASAQKRTPQVVFPWSIIDGAKLRPLVVSAHGMTDMGKVRKTNEDQFLIADLARTLRVQQTSLPQPKVAASDQHVQVFVVADGMGGHEGGEVASEVAVITIEDFLLNSLKQFMNLETVQDRSVLQEFRAALVRADAVLYEEAINHPELFGMGTTLTMALLYKSRLFIAHAGDSRCYLYSAGALKQLTRDHTLTAELLRQGAITAEEAAESSESHKVTNALGGKKQGVQAELHRLDIQPSDVLLLCSDGLTGMVDDEQIKQILKVESDPGTACRRLVAAANEQGGKDNVTVIVARFSEK